MKKNTRSSLFSQRRKENMAYYGVADSINDEKKSN